MKLSACLLALIFFVQLSIAQNGNVIVYAEKGLKFSLVIDGVNQHEGLVSDIKVTDIPPGIHRLKIRFENEKSGQASRTIFVEGNKQYTFAVLHKSVAGVDANFDKNNREIQKVLGNDPNAAPRNYDVMENYVLRLKAEGASDNNTSGNQQKASYQPRTKFSNDVHQLNENEPALVRGRAENTTTVVAEPDVKSTQEMKSTVAIERPEYSRCKGPMDENNFAATKGGLESQPSDELKINLAKQIISNICMSVDQIQEVTSSFSSEDSKMEFVKFAYEYAYDKENYSNLVEIFSEPSNQEDFNNTFSPKNE